MSTWSRFYPTLLVLSSACSPDTADTTAVASNGANGVLEAGAGSGPADGSGTGSNNPEPAPGRDDNCSDAARLVYVVDSDKQLSSFRPDTGVFTPIGTLDCPSMGGSPIPSPIPLPGFEGTPFSMSVDRDGIAWVLYDSGELFRVDTQTAACTATARMPGEGGFQTFGMGFASDAANSSEETLYIASNGGGSFGSLDTTSGVATSLGTAGGSAELTGTGAGELWGFFPDTSPPRIDLMDKGTGSALRSIPLAAIQGLPQAWAFAFWGGDFWLFLQRTGDSSTVVYRVNAKTGELTTSIPDTGKRIVGAGVSTCAPLTII